MPCRGFGPSFLCRALLSRSTGGVTREKCCSTAGELEEPHVAPCCRIWCYGKLVTQRQSWPTSSAKGTQIPVSMGWRAIPSSGKVSAEHGYSPQSRLREAGSRVASRGASGKALVSQRKAVPSTPADPAPSAACQHPARGTSTRDSRDLSAVGRSRSWTRRKVVTSWCHQDHSQVQQVEREQCQGCQEHPHRRQIHPLP